MINFLTNHIFSRFDVAVIIVYSFFLFKSHYFIAFLVMVFGFMLSGGLELVAIKRSL